MKRKLFFIIVFFLIHALSYTNSITSFRLATGDEVKLPDKNMIESDWLKDFEKIKALLIRHRKISDYLDGNKQFSFEEKAYWISYYGKSPNIKRLATGKRLLTIYQLYYIQGIVFNADNKTKKKIANIMQDLITKLYPLNVSKRDIDIIRTESSKNYLQSSPKYKEYYSLLKKKNSQNIIAHYYYNPTELKRKKIVNYYKKNLMKIEVIAKNIQDLQKKKETLKKASPEILSSLTRIEEDKMAVLKAYISITENLLAMIIQLQDNRLISDIVKERELFKLKINEKYPEIKDLF